MLIFSKKSAIIKLNEECRGRSAHDWSSQMRVGSLSRIGCNAEKQGTLQKNGNAPDFLSGAFFLLQ